MAQAGENVYKNSRHKDKVEDYSIPLNRENEFMQTNQALEVDSKVTEIEKTLHRTCRIWLASVSALMLVVFLMSVVCLILVSQMLRHIVNIQNDIDGSHMMLTSSLSLIQDQIHGVERLRTDIRENIENQTELKCQLQKLNGNLSPCKNQSIHDTSIRLVGGSGNSGRVEIFHGGEWGTICDDSWDISDAIVACRMLGYRGAISAPESASYGEGSGQIWLDGVSCAGTEISLEQCSTNSWGSHDCSHSEDASVICNNICT